MAKLVWNSRGSTLCGRYSINSEQIRPAGS